MKKKIASGDKGMEEYDNNIHKADSMEVVEPLIDDMLNGPVGLDICERYDPVIVNETAGWILALYDNEPKSDIGPIEDAVQEVGQQTQLASELCYQKKKQRGRRRKK